LARGNFGTMLRRTRFIAAGMEVEAMNGTRSDENPKPALNHTKTGKQLEEQARALEEERRVKQQEFASGRKRHTEGK
jgi:hypothetical protein